jgi:hypothetical protein
VTGHERPARVGDRVRLVDFPFRRPDVQGTAVAGDPYPDRDALLLVHFENNVRYLIARNRLRPFGIDENRHDRPLTVDEQAALLATSDERLSYVSPYEHQRPPAQGGTTYPDAPFRGAQERERA